MSQARRDHTEHVELFWRESPPSRMTVLLLNARLLIIMGGLIVVVWALLHTGLHVL